MAIFSELRRFLGGHDEHTVGTSGTVKGGRGRVLQDGHRLDGLGRDVVEHRRCDLDTVKHDQRAGVGSERGYSSNIEGRAVGSRLTRSLAGDESRNISGERGREVGGGCREIRRLHRLDGTHEGFASSGYRIRPRLTLRGRWPVRSL